MKLNYSLKTYFIDHKHMAYFYNALIKDNIDIKKNDFLTSLGISTATYNRTVKNETRSSKIIFNILEDYFKINPLNIDQLDFYNKVLSDVIIAIYYKNIDLDKLKREIQLCIDDNNYLKPIFVLFLNLINLLNVDILEILHNEYNEIYEQLKKYKDLFNVYPVNELFKYLYISTGTKDIFKDLYKYSSNNEFAGLIDNSIAINAYHNNKYDISLYYVNKAYNELIYKCNFNKLLILNLTKFASLNATTLYSETIKEATTQLIYLNLENKNPLFLKITKLHLYNAFLGLNNYKEIHNTILSMNSLDTIDYTYLLISFYFIDKKKYNEFKRKIYNLIEEKNKHYIDSLISFFECDNKDKKIEIINKSSMNKTLIYLLSKQSNE